MQRIIFRNVALWLVACCLAACSSGPDDQFQTSAATAPKLYAWYPEGLTGETRIVIDLNIQRAWISIGGRPAGWTVVATGKEGHNTPAGEYTIIEKVVDKRSNLYGITVDAHGSEVNGNADVRTDSPPPGGKFLFARMPYWMRLTNDGIGMHAGYIPQPGEPASHGCIRMPPAFAPKLFARVKIGTPVRIIH